MDSLLCPHCGKRGGAQISGEQLLFCRCSSCHKKFRMSATRKGAWGSYPVDFLEKLETHTPDQLCAVYGVSYSRIRDWIMKVNKKILKGVEP